MKFVLPNVFNNKLILCRKLHAFLSSLVLALVWLYLPQALAQARVENQTQNDASDEVFELIVAHPSYRESVQKALTIIMDQTVEKYGQYRLKKGPEMNRARAEEGITHGDIHIMWGSFSKKRISHMHPIYSYVVLAEPRVCIIAKGTQHKFSGIRSLQDWREKGLITGVGRFWIDYTIYEYNNMKLESTAKSKLLYPMVAYGRFDCFNRGAGEVLGNLESNSEYELEVERSLAFVFEGKYSGFLITAEDDYLKQRVTDGINLAWQNGAFDEEIKLMVTAQREKFKSLELEQRHFITLRNPNKVDPNQVRAINQAFMDGFLANKAR